MNNSKWQPESVVDRRLWSNMLQLVCGSIVAVAAAGYGYIVAPDTKWLGGVVGATCGFIVGVFAIGVLLAFLPKAGTFKSMNSQTYSRSQRNLAVAFLTWFCAAPICFLLVGGGWAMPVFCVPSAYLLASFAWVSDVKCPSCLGGFGYHGLTQIRDQRCDTCGSPFELSASDHAEPD